ncbi:hypothetical protein BN1723_001334 [Verticillium longisporum]|uniref:Uncharacterized protein n=1 Tax=Verticillium longisporum TaxID=100787 RepID=A0A0G4NNL4_VERLO|nr:hypothetical protein BN1723_001334 [Verticillium longisporum]
MTTYSSSPVATFLLPTAFVLFTLLIASTEALALILKPLSGLIVQSVVYWAIALAVWSEPNDETMVRSKRVPQPFIRAVLGLASLAVIAHDCTTGFLGTQAVVLRVMMLLLRARNVHAVMGRSRAVQFFAS